MMDMPAMTTSTWLELRACNAALNPSDCISTLKPSSLAMPRISSMSMPVILPFSRYSNGANVVSVPILYVLPLTEAGLPVSEASACGTVVMNAAKTTASTANSAHVRMPTAFSRFLSCVFDFIPRFNPFWLPDNQTRSTVMTATENRQRE